QTSRIGDSRKVIYGRVFGKLLMSTICRSDSNTELLSDRWPGGALRAQNGDPVSVHHYTGTAEALALRAGRFKPCLNALRDAQALLFRNCGDDRNHCIFENSAGIEIMLREAPVAYSVGSQPVQMLQGFQNALTREPVQSPEQHYVEFALAGVLKHR